MSIRTRNRATAGDWAVGCLVIVVILSIVGIFGGLIVYTIASYSHVQTMTCTVESRDRGENEGGQRVYTEECGVLSVKDAMFRGHWSAGDVYAELEPGHTYEVVTIGYRVPFLSDFPNIVEVKGEVES